MSVWDHTPDESTGYTWGESAGSSSSSSSSNSPTPSFLGPVTSPATAWSWTLPLIFFLFFLFFFDATRRTRQLRIIRRMPMRCDDHLCRLRVYVRLPDLVVTSVAATPDIFVSMARMRQYYRGQSLKIHVPGTLNCGLLPKH